MPWMVIYPLARSFSYDPISRFYKSPRWIIHNLVNCAAKGGNFMIGIGPDENGQFHPRAVQILEAAGDWLKVNGEAIYATRPCEAWHEGQDIYFTRSKDASFVYAICLKWPGRRLHLHSIVPTEGMQVHLLGMEEALDWCAVEDGIAVLMPEKR